MAVPLSMCKVVSRVVVSSTGNSAWPSKFKSSSAICDVFHILQVCL